MTMLPGWFSNLHRRVARRLRDAARRRPPRTVQPSLELLERREVPAAIRINDVALTEGNTGTQNAVFTVSLDAAVQGRNVTVEFDTLDATASDNVDYFAPSGVVVIPAGATSATIIVPIQGDGRDEANETFTITLSNPSVGDTLADSTGIGTINDDDPTPTVTVNSPTVREGNLATTNLLFIVSLSGPTFADVVINYSLAAGTATPGDNDYVDIPAGSLTVATGLTAGTITVTVNGDTAVEPNENFTLNFGGVTPAGQVTLPSNPVGTGTILSDDPSPNVLTFAAGATFEGTGPNASASLVFTIILDALPATNNPAIFTYTAGPANVAVGAATSGVDFQAVVGTVTMTTTTATFEIPILTDAVDELDETFIVTLSNPINAIIPPGRSVAMGTILDDDVVPVRIDNGAGVEGAMGQMLGLVFPVTLPTPSPQTTVLTFSTMDGSATAANDFMGVTNGTLTIGPGVPNGSITITLVGDAVIESNETFGLNITAITSGLAAAQTQTPFLVATGTISDDDGPQLRIVAASATVQEQFMGQVPALATYVVQLFDGAGAALTNVPAGRAYLVDYATASVGPPQAIPNFDFVPATGTLTFTGSTVSQTVTVSILDDFENEADETFDFVLSNPQGNGPTLGGGLGNPVTTTIVDNDAARLAIQPAGIVEGGAATFVLGLFADTELRQPIASSRTVTVDVASTDGSATLANGDYVQLMPTTVTFIPGQSVATVTVATIGDSLDEVNETFTVALSNLVSNGANITLDTTRSVATGTIADDDGGTTTPTIRIDSVTLAEGTGGTTNFVFTVTLGGPSSPAAAQDIIVNFALGAGPGVANLSNPATAADFSGGFAGGTAVISQGNRSATITIPVIADAASEADAIFTVTLTGASSSGSVMPDLTAGAGNVGTGIILNDDGPAASVANAATIVEGSTGRVTDFLNFPVTLNAPPATGQRVRVNYTTVDGPSNGAAAAAIAGTDYIAQSGVLEFRAGETTKTVRVPVLGDTAIQLSQRVTLQLLSTSLGTLGTTSTATGIVTDDDGPTVSIGSATVNELATNAIFAVNLSAPANAPVVVTFSAPAGIDTLPAGSGGGNAATAGSDFNSPATLSLTIPAGMTAASITVPVLADTTVEATETFALTLTGVAGGFARLGTATVGTGTILDNDSPTVSIGDATLMTEGPLGDIRELAFTVTLAGVTGGVPAGRVVTVDFATSGSTATSGADFIPSSGRLTFAPNTSVATLTVQVLGDFVDEPMTDEQFLVTLNNPIGVALGTPSVGTGAITDDDTAPIQALVAISDATLVEGDAGNRDALVLLTLRDPANPVALRPINGPVQVTFGLVLGSADAADFLTPALNTITIPAGSASATITIPVVGDTTFEPTETFFVNISMPQGGVALINPALPGIANTTRGTVSILNDDDVPSVAASDASVSEGTGGTTNLVFNVTLTNALAVPFTVDFATALAAGASAAGVGDFTAASGTLSFAAGQTLHQVTVAVATDSTNELNEIFLLNLSNPSAPGTIADASAMGTILDDDSPTVSIGAASVSEGNSGITNLIFTVTLSSTNVRDVTGTVATADGTATSGIDYASLTAVPFTISAGQTAGSVTVAVTGDTLAEPNETLTLTLSGVQGANPSSVTATGTITNDDPLPTVSIANVSVSEGNLGATNLVFVVSLSAPSGGAVTGELSTTGMSATAITDFSPLTALPLTLSAGQTAATISVSVNGDIDFEPNETLTLTLSGVQGATPASVTATGTILNDDPQTIANLGGGVAVIEGDTGTANAVFIVSLSAPAPAGGAVVNVSTVAGTASAGTDFTALTNQPVTVSAGGTTAQVTVTLLGDFAVEADESFTVALSLPNGSLLGLGTTSATGTILNDDQGGVVQLTSTATGGNEGATIVFTITRTGGLASGAAVTLAGVTATGSVGVSSADFTGLSQTITFTGGQTTAQVTVGLVADNIVESHDFFTVSLANAAGGLSVGTNGSIRIDVVDPSGTDVDQFVNTVYERLLGREVDQPGAEFNGSSGGLDYWRTILGPAPSTVARSGLVQLLQTTGEYRARQVNALFQQYLGQDADTASIGFWANALNQGLRQDVFEAALAASAPFLSLAGGTANGFADRLFLVTLGRARGTQDPAFTGDIADEAARLNYALQVLSTDEADRFQVRGFYQTGLGVSNPSTQDQMFWASFITPAPITPQFSEPRFFATFGRTPVINIEDLVLAEMMSNLVPVR